MWGACRVGTRCCVTLLLRRCGAQRCHHGFWRSNSVIESAAALQLTRRKLQARPQAPLAATRALPLLRRTPHPAQPRGACITTLGHWVRGRSRLPAYGVLWAAHTAQGERGGRGGFRGGGRGRRPRAVTRQGAARGRSGERALCAACTSLGGRPGFVTRVKPRAGFVARGERL